jgi:hypothetical protein
MEYHVNSILPYKHGWSECICVVSLTCRALLVVKLLNDPLA